MSEQDARTAAQGRLWKVRTSFPVDHGQAYFQTQLVQAWTRRGAVRKALAGSLNLVVEDVSRV